MLLAFIAGLVAIAILWRIFSGEVGARYDRESDFFRAQREAGWQVMGRYTPTLAFPAKVVGVQTARDAIQFTRPDGVLHNYPNFAGKEFKLYTFQPDDSATDRFVLLMVRS